MTAGAATTRKTGPRRHLPRRRPTTGISGLCRFRRSFVPTKLRQLQWPTRRRPWPQDCGATSTSLPPARLRRARELSTPRSIRLKLHRGVHQLPSPCAPIMRASTLRVRSGTYARDGTSRDELAAVPAGPPPSTEPPHVRDRHLRTPSHHDLRRSPTATNRHRRPVTCGTRFMAARLSSLLISHGCWS
jgi:hypothetical protein